MRVRSLLLPVALVALLAAACGATEPATPAADRAVAPDTPEYDLNQTVLRTLIIEDALDDGLDRTQASCMVDTTLAAGEYELEELEGIDLSAQTRSGAPGPLADVLADSLVNCGRSLAAELAATIPGADTIPATHAEAATCVSDAFVDVWRNAYADRFSAAPGNGGEPEDIDVSGSVVDIIEGCSAGGAVVLGASNQGNLDTFALSTLEWTCLDSRIEPDDFLPAFPFPEEPGDALERLGATVEPDVAFCEAWVASDDGGPSDAEVAPEATGEPNG